jgi:hypothetical protein
VAIPHGAAVPKGIDVGIRVASAIAVVEVDMVVEFSSKWNITTAEIIRNKTR